MNGPNDVNTVRYLKPPTREQIAAYAARRNLQISPEEIDDELAGVTACLAVFERLDELETPRFPVRYPRRDPGRAPTEAEDPYNAIIRFCEVQGANSGPLAGMRIGIKDNIAVAGVPMTEGNHCEPIVVPTEDAVVVERLLDAGATIVAKTSLGRTSAGVTRNPLNPRFSPGGSSSGSAAAVAARIVDAAVGADQGGSVRIPSAHCGIVGMKATHGLVPTYGLAYWDHTLDHIGPMTTTIADNAAMLEVLAGDDWRDPQWIPVEPNVGDYTGAAGLGIAGLRFGVITEALKPVGCTARTIEVFERSQRTLATLGAEVVPVSVPLWTDAGIIWWASVTSGLTAMAESFGQGYGHLGRVDIDRLATTAAQYRLGYCESPWLGRIFPLIFEHLRNAYLGVHFGRAQNLRMELRRQLDSVLGDVDLLITPTTPTGPTELTSQRLADLTKQAFVLDDTLVSRISTGLSTSAVNLTGHPALTVPSGFGDCGLPTGLQIIGRRFDEHAIYRAGFALESS